MGAQFSPPLGVTLLIFLSSWVFSFGGGTAFMESKKQMCIVDSIMTAQFIAIALASKEAN